MNIPFVDLKAQYLTIKDEVKEGIDYVLENTMFIGGKPVDDFKRGFEELYGVDHCVPCANGTDAIFIVMKMMSVTSWVKGLLWSGLPIFPHRWATG